jgi:sugar phosphate isomerase/epimerase
MRFALCNEMFQDMPWEQALDLTCQYGYTGWEIAPFTLGEQPHKLSPSERKKIGELLTGKGVEMIGLHWLLAKTQGFHLTTHDADVRRRTAEYLGELVRLCRDLGGSLMVLGSPQQRNFPADMTHAQADANALTVLEMLVPVLESHQVTLALEPLGPGEGNYWNHASQVVDVIERIASPYVQLHLDVKAMSTEGIPIETIIHTNAPHLVHFHANDPNLLGPGMGEVKFEPIFQALQAVEYEGWVSVEVFDYAPGAEVIAKESMRNMRTALGLS